MRRSEVRRVDLSEEEYGEEDDDCCDDDRNRDGEIMMLFV
jgi:hypothetical protein